MCGRYQFSADEYKEIRQIVRDAQRRSEGNELNFPMAGDICPSQVAPVLVSRGEKIVGEFQQWGLPGFRGRQQIINARAETVTEKPMFRRSIAFQRCVIPATGFYEWDAAKHKYFFQMAGQPIYLAGIYDNINSVNCFIILTTAPNDSVAPIHDRMPLLLS
ncbi:MAG: SOS response-associated peptidase, partial [Ruminococcus sp.]|nr:SOS response-associated peptidase [Ruminococcus sp.]